MEDYQDRLSLATPEGVRVDLVLAGVGSRFAAALVDLAIKALVVLALVVIASVVGGGAVLVVGTIAAPVIYLAYDVLFEVLGGGRTPGKRACGLRVLRADGRPVDLLASVIRNVVRVVDGLPLLYAPSMVAILATRRNQRLGDLVGSTIVVRDAPRTTTGAAPAGVAGGLGGWRPPGPGRDAPVLDVTQVTPRDLAALRAFLARRATLEVAARGELAGRLAEAVRPRVGGATDGLRPEELIAEVVAAKDAAG